MLTDILLPSSLRLDKMTIEDKVVVCEVSSTQIQGECPDCHQHSQRVHSWYMRTVADLPWGEVMLYFHLNIHRFFCDNQQCQRKTFTEKLPEFVAPYARRTLRLATQQRATALTLGGEAGARLLEKLTMPTSGDTLLRLIRNGASDPPAHDKVCVVGIDDWAWRKGQSYGTILVDLEAHCPLDLLPDRSAESVAAWLKAHPGIEIICRDRAEVYMDGATQGAPGAIQVADRWHLLANLRDVLERLLERHRVCLYAAAAKPEPPNEPQAEDVLPETSKKVEPQLTKTEQNRQATRKRRLARYQTVVELHRQGVKMRAIARQLGMSPRTIRRYIEAGSFPEMAQRRKTPSILDPFLPYLNQRWQAGYQNASQLYREIKAQGYPGCQSLVGQWAGRKRQLLSTAIPTNKSSTTTKSSVQRPWSAGYAVWLLIKAPEKLSDEEQATLDRMLQASPVVKRAYQFGQAFLRIVRQRYTKAFNPWLEALLESDLTELRAFARSLKKDQDAVWAALSLPWSNAQVEGQINRLKFIKRQMYGRAKFDLLRLRVLATT
jgi:transposase